MKIPQSAGFVMANIALNGTATELGITDSTMWIQPADAHNGYDALKGEKQYFKSPSASSLSQVPVGITFSTVKSREETTSSKPVRHHSCQILCLAEHAWFEEFAPEGGGDLESSRHAPPHVKRKNQELYVCVLCHASANFNIFLLFT